MFYKIIVMLLALALFALSHCINAAVEAEASLNKAPEATAEEAKLVHWRMPDSERRFTDLPLLETAFIEPSPTKRSDGLIVGQLGSDAGDKEMIVQLANELREDTLGNYDSLLIAHKGKLLFESYFRRGRIDLSHPQSSATKSYTGLALGRAIQLGYLSMSDLHKPVISFFDDLDPSLFVEGVEQITLHHALTMTTGIRISDEGWEAIRSNDNPIRGQQEIQQILQRTAPITPETHVFKYGTGPQFVMQVIETRVPGTAKDFIQKEVLGKLGITRFSWRTAASGLPSAGSGASLTSRDMLKIGILYMNKGKWNGEQFIPQAFAGKTNSPVIDTSDIDVFGGGNDVFNQGYGYFWWNADMKAGGKSYYSSSAQGGGGMYIVLIDELDLTIVVTAHHRNDATLQLIAERILPAFK